MAVRSGRANISQSKRSHVKILIREEMSKTHMSCFLSNIKAKLLQREEKKKSDLCKTIYGAHYKSTDKNIYLTSQTSTFQIWLSQKTAAV